MNMNDLPRLGEQFIWFFGVIEDRGDPLRLGRVRVRCYGWHTDDKNELPTKDLPWSQPLQPTTSSGMSGFGSSSVGLFEGSFVVGFFIDGYDAQQPIIMGSIAGMPTKGPNTAKGFNDPNGLYPYLTNESDLNRLARNDSKFPHPLIKSKTDNQVTSVPIANSINTWNEPEYAYNAKYPHNHVQQSESGHIREIDDTIDNERIHEYHKSGTFYEIDSRGNRILKIEGKDYKIVIGDGHLYVDGNLNITVAKKLNIKCKELNIEVSNDVNKKYGGNEIEKIGGNVTQTIVGNETKTVGGNLTQTIVGNETDSETSNAYSLTVGGRISIGSVGEYVHESKKIHLNKLSTPPEALDKVPSISVSSPDAKLGSPSSGTPGGAKSPLLVVNDRAADGSRTSKVTNKSAGPTDSSGGPVRGVSLLVPMDVAAATRVSGNCNDRGINLGSLTSQHESNNNLDAVGRESNGTFSYGLYQINTGGTNSSFNLFMKYLEKNHPDKHSKLESAGGEKEAKLGPPKEGEEKRLSYDKFIKVFKEEMDKKTQHGFIKAAFFDKAVTEILKDTGINVCNQGAGLQEAIWSTSVQHGPNGAKNIFNKALVNTGKEATKVTDEELIEAIYDERGRTNAAGVLVYFDKESPSIQKSIAERFKKEKKEALKYQ